MHSHIRLIRGGRRAQARVIGFVVLSCLALLGASGCAVPQARGSGQLERVVEPTSQRGYWRYLPKTYVASSEHDRKTRRWPLVVTFHGMKPFDNAYPQACEWQVEADRYGYVVIAPELVAPDVMLQFPVREVTSSFKADENAVIAIMDHLFSTTQADPSNVLSTSWSSGGYMAHYMVNRHPDRFTCLAVRQSNFSSNVLDGSMAEKSIYHPILIVNTQNDFAVCLKESKEAREWYANHGFKNVAWIQIRHLGHERTPDLAADFFGRVAGVEPLSPPSVLVQRQAIDGNAEGLAFFAGKSSGFNSPIRSSAVVNPPPQPRSTPVRVETPSRPRAADDDVLVRRPSDTDETLLGNTTPNRGTAAAKAAPKRNPLAIRVSSAIGLQPMMLSFWAEAPSDWGNTASFQWTLDGKTIGNGLNGQKTLGDAGEFTLGLLAVTSDGSEFRTARTIRVLPKASTASTN